MKWRSRKEKGMRPRTWKRIGWRETRKGMPEERMRIGRQKGRDEEGNE